MVLALLHKLLHLGNQGTDVPAGWLESAAGLPPESRRTCGFNLRVTWLPGRSSEVDTTPDGMSSAPSVESAGFEHMKCFELARMFAGLINRRLVISCHPFFVVCAKGIAAEFATVEAAEQFLSGRGYGAGCIYRHNGRDWDKLEKNPWVIDRVELGSAATRGEES